jgi:hypothetical protein
LLIIEGRQQAAARARSAARAQSATRPGLNDLRLQGISASATLGLRF